MENERYIRQTLLPEISSRGQEQLAASCVLIAGAGGLGSASALYLAGAGVGHIRIVDPDVVEISNLNRQILHSEAFLGFPKVVSAASRLKGYNAQIRISPLQEKITAASIDSLMEGVDIIVDACDSYETRQILNRGSLRHHRPFVYAGITGFDLMISCFVPGQTPCFECIIPEPAASPGQISGVIGPAAGMAGCLQAVETIKLLLGIGTPLTSRLLRITGLGMRIHCMKIEPNPDCRICQFRQKQKKGFM